MNKKVLEIALFIFITITIVMSFFILKNDTVIGNVGNVKTEIDELKETQDSIFNLADHLIDDIMSSDSLSKKTIDSLDRKNKSRLVLLYVSKYTIDSITEVVNNLKNDKTILTNKINELDSHRMKLINLNNSIMDSILTLKIENNDLSKTIELMNSENELQYEDGFVSDIEQTNFVDTCELPKRGKFFKR